MSSSISVASKALLSVTFWDKQYKNIESWLNILNKSLSSCGWSSGLLKNLPWEIVSYSRSSVRDSPYITALARAHLQEANAVYREERLWRGTRSHSSCTTLYVSVPTTTRQQLSPGHIWARPTYISTFNFPFFAQSVSFVCVGRW